MTEVLQIAAAILGSLGGAGLIVLALSSWLGKVWANRLMEQERVQHERQLEKLRAELQRTNQRELSELKTDLDVFAQKYLKHDDDKLRIYRAVIEIIANLLADLRLHQQNLLTDEARREVSDNFDRQRMKAYGYMAMLAPQTVMDANDEMMDYLIAVGEAEEEYDWPKIRGLALSLINAIRADIGFDTTPVEYRGDR